MLILDINVDSLQDILKRTTPSTWNRFIMVSKQSQKIIHDMIKVSVNKLIVRIQTVHSLKATIQAEALIHLFLKPTIRENRNRLALTNNHYIINLLKNNLTIN